MNEEYSEYLNSREWQAKRALRLAKDEFKCVACGRKNGIQVHHLTYERIFHEDIEDLMSLCYIHHKIVESLIFEKKLSRIGCVEALRADTMALLDVRGDHGDTMIQNYKQSLNPRNKTQGRLLSEPWFSEALKLGRKKFKAFVRAQPNYAKFMGNACALYDRMAASQLNAKLGCAKTERKARRSFRKAKTFSVGTSYYPLFKHMADAHGLTLTDSELHEITLVCGRMASSKALTTLICEQNASEASAMFRVIP